MIIDGLSMILKSQIWAKLLLISKMCKCALQPILLLPFVYPGVASTECAMGTQSENEEMRNVRGFYCILVESKDARLNFVKYVRNYVIA